MALDSDHDEMCLIPAKADQLVAVYAEKVVKKP